MKEIFIHPILIYDDMVRKKKLCIVIQLNNFIKVF